MNFKPRTSFSLHEATQPLVTGQVLVTDAEVMLARAIDYIVGEDEQRLAGLAHLFKHR